MKEATGEVSMTVVTLIAIAVIGGILALFWQPITNKIGSLWGENAGCPSGYTMTNGACVKQNG